MKRLIQLLQILPWLGLIVVILWLWNKDNLVGSKEVIITNQTILKEIESIGKLELVKYNFKEITELKKISPEYLKIFKLGPDSKIALISIGEATGCIDLTKIEDKDIALKGDTLFIQLPKPELCYYKLDLAKTRIYSLQTNPLIDEKEFVRKAYEAAESEIKTAALNSGIIDNTNTNAALILSPILEKMTGKKVVFSKKPDNIELDQPL